MKTKTNYILLVLAVLLLSIDTADACSLNPTAVITTDPDATVFYNDEPVLLSGENSVANCGFITEYRWLVSQIGGGGWQQIYVGSSPTYNYTFPFLEDGESEKAYDLQLVVRNSSNNYHTRTIQVTITRDNKSFYYLTDHLGSVRVTVDERGDPVGWDDYYPFGLQMPGRSQQQYGSPETDVKFTGYELNQEGGLGLYHAGARLYDPEVGRFMQQDPMTDMYPGFSPYIYTLNNPLIFIDPDGREVRCANEEDCQEAAEELNEIHNNETNITVVEAEWEESTSVWYKPWTWGEKKTVSGFKLSTSESDFDWSSDIYVSALYDVINSPEINFTFEFVSPDYVLFPRFGSDGIAAETGGRLKSHSAGGHVQVASKHNLGEPIGVTIMHELVGHGHPVSKGINAMHVNRHYQKLLGFPMKGGATHIRGFHERIKWKNYNLYERKK